MSVSQIGGAGQRPGAQSPLPEGPEARLRESCREVEAIFIDRLLAAMDRSPWGEGLFGGSTAEQVFRMQRNQQLAVEMSRREALGIGEMLYRELAGQLKHDAPEQARRSQPSEATRVRDHED